RTPIHHNSAHKRRQIRRELTQRHASQVKRTETGLYVRAPFWPAEVEGEFGTGRRSQAWSQRPVTRRPLESEYRQLTLLTVRGHLEPVFEQRSQHGQQLRVKRAWSGVGRPRLNVEAISRKPLRTADDLVILELKRCADQEPQRNVRSDKAATRLRHHHDALIV